MEVYISDKDKKWDISYSLSDSNNSLDCKDHKPIIVKSLEQHDKEVKKQVIEELRNWNDKCIDCGYLIDCNDLEQKLNELEVI